jgi:hypothetical protein
MAIVAIEKTELSRNELSAMPSTVAVDATDGAAIAYDKADQKILIILENAAGTENTGSVLAGNGIQGARDLDFTLAAGGVSCMVVESGKYVNASGTNKGKLLIEGADANIKVACVVLP